MWSSHSCHSVPVFHRARIRYNPHKMHETEWFTMKERIDVRLRSLPQPGDDDFRLFSADYWW